MILVQEVHGPGEVEHGITMRMKRAPGKLRLNV